jgi:hypothetical protein
LSRIFSIGSKLLFAQTLKIKFPAIKKVSIIAAEQKGNDQKRMEDFAIMEFRGTITM